jgi:hypothetical protein
MKKIYILAIAAFAFTVNTNAQINDDFEGYNEGPISSQSINFSTWSGPDGTAEDSSVATSQASNGTKSMNVISGNDMLFDFDGGVNDGIYSYQFKVYLESGSTGFIGLMSDQGDTNVFGASLYINEPNNAAGSGIFIGGAVTGDFFDIPEGQWVTLLMVMDLDNDTMTLAVDGTVVYDDILALEGAGLLVADIWANDGDTDFYMDEVIFQEGVLGAEDFNADVFSVYPNPVVNTLNINSAEAVDNITVFDVLGKVVLNVTPGVSSPAIDMSSLNSGVYLVNVSINGTSKTVKVIK